MQTLVFATCKFDAKNAQSQYEPQFTTVVAIDANRDERLYWKAGGIADFLKAGDVVTTELSKGKWRLSRTQAPELLQTLEARRIAVSTAAPTTTTQTATRQATTTIEDDCEQMVRIFNYLRRAALPLPQGSLSQTPDECIQSMACTI
ncbi:MAG: hypothetical protein SFY66_18490 [Oculatellaceae cyanobacterium bins.114]|nr:hypothetical protein [Oculatellaceae cyanobacterium bins.114]